MSRTGLLVASDVPLPKGEVIVVEFSSGSRHRAEIMWADDRLFGCRFLTALSRASLSAALLRAPPMVPSFGLAEIGPQSDYPNPIQPGALTTRAKAAIIGSAALVCWVCLASAIFVLAD